MHSKPCPSCDQARSAAQMIAGSAVLPHIVAKIQEHAPAWSPEQKVCAVCVSEAMAADAEDMLKQDDSSTLSPLEREFVESLRAGGMLSGTMAQIHDGSHLSLSERFAERVASIVGSFAFAGTVLILVIIWLYFSMTSGLVTERPALVFGGLSSGLGAIAAIQNPIILMSQRLAARRDRMRNENDYRIDLKSELEVRYINAKLDYILEKISDLHATDQNKTG